MRSRHDAAKYGILYSMYLKQLDIIGFKSFADRTRLTFDPGLIMCFERKKYRKRFRVKSSETVDLPDTEGQDSVETV